ncbi:GyrI-like domain-containing protein, partial [Cronobacter sakazakii]|nr:GyrI-like domain-containing protein [Cronobacter sakazakii]
LCIIDLYLQFTYEGPGTGLQDLILTVYGTCLPALGLTRRRGQDIERYLLTEASGSQAGDINLR